jgi:hypothetical protein
VEGVDLGADGLEGALLVGAEVADGAEAGGDGRLLVYPLTGGGAAAPQQ